MSITTKALLKDVARGELKNVNLLKYVYQGRALDYGVRQAKFVKQGPGNYDVFLYEEAQETKHYVVNGPIEAKLIVLDWVIEAAKEELSKDVVEHA